MEQQPQLSPDLRPLHYCPNCGQRVAQRAETCFMCGYDLQASERRRLRLPLGDLLVIAVVIGVAYLWWTRSPRPVAETPVQPRPQPAVASPAPPPTATIAPAVVLGPTATLTPTAAITISAALTATAPITPTNTPGPVEYVVVNGDTVEKIATRFGIGVRDLMAANGMSNDFLQVDQKLTIPSSQPAAPAEATAPATPVATATPIVYAVKRGDTVEKIADAFGVSVRDLLTVNEMSNDLIQVGQKLVIPSDNLPRGPDGKLIPTPTPTPKNAIYLVVVRSGDTIETIAKRLGSSIEAIVQANERIETADTIIRPGEQLIVPVGTITATNSLGLQQPPTATPVPTPTPTAGPRWPAPQLLSPIDGAATTGSSVLLQWLSVGLLDTQEVYVLRVAPAGRNRDELTAVTTGTSYRVPQDWLESFGRRTDRFVWSVQVARDVRSIAGRVSGLRAASPSSDLRTFTWQP